MSIEALYVEHRGWLLRWLQRRLGWGALKGLGLGATVVSVGDRIVLSGQNCVPVPPARIEVLAFR